MLKISSVIGLFNELGEVKSIIKRSVSFIKMRGKYVEFVY
jgi:hypothetical protein